MNIKQNLYSQRIISIDAFRGITIFIMVFVNELSGVSNIPAWMKHMPREADGMSFVDLVFPAFLFIVGMSIPFAFNARLLKNDTTINIWKHTLKRSFALIVMGLYMVNIEYGYDPTKMIISVGVWGFLAYLLPIPIWNKYSRDFPVKWKKMLQYASIAVLVGLYFVYVQDNGTPGMTVKWWGILGLIGWAYLFTVVYYWMVQGKLSAMVIFVLVAIALRSVSFMGDSGIENYAWFEFLNFHLTHASIAGCGVIISLVIFESKTANGIHWKVIGFGFAFFLLGYLLRPYFEISKIRATPSWCLYSSAICTVLYYALYWLMEKRKVIRWSSFFMPAAANPLLIYILPGMLIYLNMILDLYFIPEVFTSGVPGIIWSLVFSTIMLLIMRIFNKLKIQLHL